MLPPLWFLNELDPALQNWTHLLTAFRFAEAKYSSSNRILSGITPLSRLHQFRQDRFAGPFPTAASSHKSQ
jgi:hypothetical protein